MLGHLIGILMGYLSLVVTGLTSAGPALAVGITAPRIIAVALSLALTNRLMVLFDVSHPPAAATTLIISWHHHPASGVGRSYDCRRAADAPGHYH